MDVVGWRLDEVVDLIRGPKDSIVRLQVLPKNAGPDGPPKIINLTRNTIQLEDQAARQKVLTVEGAQGPQKIGVIEIPTFYMDFEARMRGEENYRSTTRDVRHLIAELTKQGIIGLIIDGDSTQHLGVIPDVVFPSNLSTKDQGERALKQALPFAHIPPAEFIPTTDHLLHLEQLRAQHQTRVKTDKAYLALLDQERAVQEVSDKKSVSLLESQRRKEHLQSRLDQRMRENAIRVAHGKAALPATPKPEEDDDDEGTSADEAEREKPTDDFDVVLEEASKVLRDAVELNAPTGTPAATAAVLTPPVEPAATSAEPASAAGPATSGLPATH